MVTRRYPISVTDKASRICRSDVQRLGRVCRGDISLATVFSDRPRKSPPRYQTPLSSHPTIRPRPSRRPDCKARSTGYRRRCRSLDRPILKERSHRLTYECHKKNCRKKKIDNFFVLSLIFQTSICYF